MFKNQQFIASVFNVSGLPKFNLPEIILCGRSNVGKSSFINSLFNRKDLAKTSSTPGKTRSINYYLIDNKFYFVDLPGYGYAKASLSERKKWGNLIDDFLKISKNIELTFHLIDSRHNPTELDIQLNKLLKQLEIPYVVLLNKSDKLKHSELSKNLKKIKNFFPELVYNQNLFYFSSIDSTGNKDVKKILSAIFYE
jgi:GTP-binding protein